MTKVIAALTYRPDLRQWRLTQCKSKDPSGHYYNRYTKPYYIYHGLITQSELTD